MTVCCVQNSSVSVGEEVITVSGGVCFYLQHTKSGSKDDSTFLTQDEGVHVYACVCE